MKPSREEILETIWKADERGESKLDLIAKDCPVEVNDEELTYLQKNNLITRENDEIHLTFEGRNQARSLIRRHRLAETLFATVLDLDPKKREAIACEAEHILLPEVEESICILLGHPNICPDGKPIPPGNCCSTKRDTASTMIVNLTTLKPGEKGRITYIKPKSHSRLHKLTSFGLIPGMVIELHQSSPVTCIRYEGTELALNNDVAEDIFVAKIK